MIEITLKNADARLLLKALYGSSVTDPKVAAIYEMIEARLADEAPQAPWRKVVRAGESSAYRGNNCAANLFLECDHSIRETGLYAWELNKQIARGDVIKRRCSECAGGPQRRANP